LDPYLTSKLILLAVLFLLFGIFTCSEAALFSLTPLHLHRMQEDRFPFTGHIQRLLENPRRLLVTIIVYNEATNIAFSALATALFISFLGRDGQWIAIAVLTPLILIFCEAMPKTFGKMYPMRFSSYASPVVLFFMTLGYPLIRLMEGISAVFSSFFRGTQREERVLTEDTFRSLVEAGHEEGVIEKTERDLIHRVFKLGDTEVSAIMTPRVDMFCLPVVMGVDEMKREIIEQGYSRIPVHGTGGIDDVLGILYARDLLARAAGLGQAVRIESLLKKPFFVPPQRRADALLRDFQVRKVHMAVVVDEYGGVEGLVTMEDILESLFGDIYDERDTIEDLYHRVDEHTFIVSGMMPIERFNELTGAGISHENFDTVGGYVFHLFGRLPVKGEEISEGGYAYGIEKMGKARVLRVRVRKEAVHDG
jgi:CBS domain containing-hemolysin-like protein